MFDIHSQSQRMGLIGSDIRRAMIAGIAAEKYKRLPEAVTYPFEPDDFNVLEFTYYEDENICYDDCGFPIFNLFDYITPGQYRLFKQDRVDIVIPSITDGLWVSLTYMKKGEPIYD